MPIWKGRYLMMMLMGYLAVFALCLWMPTLSRGWIWLAAGVCVLAFSAFLFLHEKRSLGKKKTIALCAVMLVITLAATLLGVHFVRGTLLPMETLCDGEPHATMGYVEDVIYEEPFGASYHVRLMSVDGKPMESGITLSVDHAAGLNVDDEISCAAVFSPIEEEYAGYYRAKGVFLASETDELMTVGVRERPVSSMLRKVRAYLAEGFDTYIGGEVAGFAAALLTGDREDLSGVTRLDFQRLGISHLLAVSGLHLSIVIGGVDAVLRFLTVPKRKKNVALIAMALFFTALCGFTPSVMRAAIMLSVLYLGELLGEKSDSLTSLFFAAAVIVTVRPWATYDAGLWLSFFATLGILIVISSCETWLVGKREDGALLSLGKRLLRAVCLLLLLNFAATAFTLPTAYLLYGGISLVSPIANIIFVPMVQVLLFFIVLTALLLPIPFAASAFGKVCAVLIDLLTDMAHAFSDMEGIYFSLRYPFAGLLIAVFAAGILAVAFFMRAKIRGLLAVFLASAIVFSGCYFVFRRMEMSRTEVFLATNGKSDVIGMTCSGETVLIDITTGGKALPLDAVTFLSERGIYEADALVLTHLHLLHAGTVRRLCEQMRIEKLCLPAPVTAEEDAVADLIYEAVGDILEIETYVRGDVNAKISFSSFSLFLPMRAEVSRSNHPVISFSADIHDLPWAREWIYIGSSGFESVTALSDAPLVIAGAHGPVTKNIFSHTLLDGAHTVIFSDPTTVGFTERERITADIRYAEELITVSFE